MNDLEKKTQLLMLALPVCFEEIRQELVKTGIAMKKVGELLLWAFGLNLILMGIVYSLFDGVTDLQSLSEAANGAKFIWSFQVAVNLGYFVAIVVAFFEAGKHLSQAVTSRQVEDLGNLLKKP